jgi:4-hydroxy-tetrahydrodipicolinate synthase
MGVISVLSNVVPKAAVELCNKFFAGDVAGAMQMQKQYLPLTNALFCEVNPIPVKAAMAALGFCENYLRLPLVPMEEGHRQHLLACMRGVGLDV